MKDFSNGMFSQNITCNFSDSDSDSDNDNDNDGINESGDNCSGTYTRKKNNDGKNINNNNCDNNHGDDNITNDDVDNCPRNDTSENNVVGNNNNNKNSNDHHTNNNYVPLQFDIVTGTPPYFPAKNGALPRDPGRGQCAFECRGGIETYVRACSRNISNNAYARFFVCQTYIELSRTERSVEESGMQIVKRLDVYGREGQKNPLFCVFCIRKLGKVEIEVKRDERGNRRDVLAGEGCTSKGEKGAKEEEDSPDEQKEGNEENKGDDQKSENGQIDGPSNERLHGRSNSTASTPPPVSVPYCIVPLYVRKLCGCHTAEYDGVMREMGRPLSTCTCVSTCSPAT